MREHLINNLGTKGIQVTNGRYVKYLASARYAPEATCLSQLLLVKETVLAEAH